MQEDAFLTVLQTNLDKALNEIPVLEAVGHVSEYDEYDQVYETILKVFFLMFYTFVKFEHGGSRIQLPV